ncbi:hypothetical protein EX30DRAFT_398071 [Ascodesmis nigricans]|uniref:Uncharacterized protein n=1 Tax=Ascodesmis nigricans TaxID=341454 RepID=A0A4S2MRR4_9PEZI|nr:hypothetical protein EX30DRAFT_398071 [Ascodesmis nigricans]
MPFDGSRTAIRDECLGLLIRPRQAITIFEELKHSGRWGMTDDIDELQSLSTSDLSQILLMMSTEGTRLTLWPEAVYNMAVDTLGRIEVPNIYSIWATLIEKNTQITGETSPRIRTS